MRHFGSFRLDTEARTLFRGPEPVSGLGQRAVTLLAALLDQPGALVSKDALIEAAWPGLTIEESNLPVQIAALRRELGVEPGGEKWIETLARRGYRYVGPTIALDTNNAVPKSPSIAHDVTPSASPPRLSIVVLPFANISGDPEQDYFVDGLTDSLTTDLSRIRDSFVIAYNTALTFKGKAFDVKQIGSELNVRYVLEGSVQRHGNRLRMNVQLIDAETRTHLWAERFEKPVADLFDMQDEIVSRLANILDAQLIVAEARRAERSQYPDAMDMYFRGMASIFQGLIPGHLIQARGFFERALTIDPQSVQALVGIAFVDLTMGGALLNDDRAALFSTAEEHALRALSLAPDHAVAHTILGDVYIFTNRTAQGIAECEHALALNRNLAEAHGYIGFAKLLMGRAAETEGHIREALRLSPRDVFHHRWLYLVGQAKLQLAADAEAIDWLRRSIAANRNYPPAYFALAAALGLRGVLDEARTPAKAGLALNPIFSIQRFRSATSSDNSAYLGGRDRICEGMRLAGLPEN